jgi:hypothetical protein
MRERWCEDSPSRRRSILAVLYLTAREEHGLIRAWARAAAEKLFYPGATP